MSARRATSTPASAPRSSHPRTNSPRYGPRGSVSRGVSRDPATRSGRQVRPLCKPAPLVSGAARRIRHASCLKNRLAARVLLAVLDGTSVVLELVLDVPQIPLRLRLRLGLAVSVGLELP